MKFQEDRGFPQPFLTDIYLLLGEMSNDIAGGEKSGKTLIFNGFCYFKIYSFKLLQFLSTVGLYMHTHPYDSTHFSLSHIIMNTPRNVICHI